MNFDYRLKCKRCVNGIQVKPPPEDSDCNSDLSQWHHCNTKKNVEDLALNQVGMLESHLCTITNLMIRLKWFEPLHFTGFLNCMELSTTIFVKSFLN